MCVCVFLISTLRAIKEFEPRFTVDRGDSVTYFQFLHVFGMPYCRVMYMLQWEDAKDDYISNCCIVV